VFVLTHHAREPVTKQGGTTFTFVTEGIEAALEQAVEAAAGKDVAVGGGANVAQQYLKAGLLDELQIHVVPVLLGDGVRLFEEHLASAPGAVERTRVVESPTGVTHLKYRVVKGLHKRATEASTTARTESVKRSDTLDIRSHHGLGPER
jgi:dihydrofolate reductase